MNSKFAQQAMDGQITFKKIELLIKLTDILVIEIDFQTFRLLQL